MIERRMLERVSEETDRMRVEAVRRQLDRIREELRNRNNGGTEGDRAAADQ